MRFGLDVTVPFSHQKPMCHWCGNSLDRIRNVYKGVGSSRLYCGAEHCEKGEQRVVALAGTVHSRWYVAVAGIIAVLMVAFATTPKARAHDHNGFNYGQWQRAEGKGSCCNEQKQQTDGTMTGDCRPARAYPDDNGQWHVLIRGQYRLVPQSAIRDYPTPDGNSHVCEDENNGIMCFVRGLPKS